MAVIYCLIRKVKIKEVFPVKKVKVREVIGCILLVLGIFPVSLMLVALTAIIFPQAASEVGELNSFIFGNLNFPLAVLIVALLPAICEEAIHRGAILSNFRGIKHDWVIVLIMGIFFGINHMSVLRFLTTMTLGLFLSYVVVKKNNIILSMIMHFTNNFISVAISYALGQNGAAVSSSATVDYSAVIGTYMVIGFASPILITLGLMLVYPEGHKKIRFLYAGVMAAALLVGGFMINAGNAKKNIILNTGLGTQPFTVMAKDLNTKADLKLKPVSLLDKQEKDEEERGAYMAAYQMLMQQATPFGQIQLTKKFARVLGMDKELVNSIYKNPPEVEQALDTPAKEKAIAARKRALLLQLKQEAGQLAQP